MTAFRIMKVCALGGLLLFAGGCWRHYYYAHGPVPVRAGVTYIHHAPPPPRRHKIPPRPAPGAVWIGGYWSWSGVEFVWREGYWERRPPARKTWRDGSWIHTPNGWYWRPGEWR